jgi:alpha-1,3-rhamnosyltransferase
MLATHSEAPAAASAPAATAEPLVTAVLVCWNHERFVEAAVRSVLAQSYGNIQLIVFDNGSTDGSRGILQQLEREHGFKLVLQENIGLVRTLNLAMRMAEGQYFAVLATDDIWLPGKTRTQVDYLQAHPAVALVIGAIKTIDAEGRPVDRANPMPHFEGEVRFEDLLKQRKTTNGPTVMCRTDTLREIGGYDEDIRIEDAALAMKLTSKGHRVVGLPDVLTLYRRHGANWTAQQPLWPDVCDIGKKYCRSPAEYRWFVRHRLSRTFRRLAGTQKAEAIRMLRNQPILWPSIHIAIGLLKLAMPMPLLSLRPKPSTRPS